MINKYIITTIYQNQKALDRFNAWAGHTYKMNQEIQEHHLDSVESNIDQFNKQVAKYPVVILLHTSSHCVEKTEEGISLSVFTQTDNNIITQSVFTVDDPIKNDQPIYYFKTTPMYENKLNTDEYIRKLNRGHIVTFNDDSIMTSTLEQVLDL